MRIRTAASALALLLATSLSAVAADNVYAPYDPAPAPLAPAANDYGDADFVFELGVSGIVSPEYLGSDEYQINPSPIISVEYLNLPGIGSFTVVDGHTVGLADLGSNFFLDEASLGKPRAECVTQMLRELNEHVAGSYVNEDIADVLEARPDFHDAQSRCELGSISP